MEVNTVVISLDRLKELELAEKKYKFQIQVNFIKQEFSECLERLLVFLANEIKAQKKEIEMLKEEVKITIDDVKKMNYWDFRNWKKS